LINGIEFLQSEKTSLKLSFQYKAITLIQII